MQTSHVREVIKNIELLPFKPFFSFSRVSLRESQRNPNNTM